MGKIISKIRRWYRSIPIWLAFLLLAAAGLLGAAYLANHVTSFTYGEMAQIQLRYENIEPLDFGDMVASESLDTVDVVIWQGWGEQTKLSTGAYRLYRSWSLLARFGPVAIYSALLLLAVMVFYRSKVKKPLTMLEAASDKIANSELDFSLDYEGQDEMARLCAAFEKMRSALDGNNRQLLHLLDERRQLNDAYTHDLRTPIAVLKGYTELLEKYLPAGKLSDQEVLETVRTMSAQVARLEQFVGSMNTAQGIADLTIRRERVPTKDVVSGMEETAKLLSGGKGLEYTFSAPISAETLTIDPAAVNQVFENLLGNALRFAKSKITLELTLEGPLLTLRVADDGKGFSPKELLSATKPYYCGEQELGSYHFGLGLHICRTLCEKHGGSLLLRNGPDGGAEVTANFSCEPGELLEKS